MRAGRGKTLEKKLEEYQKLLAVAELNNWFSLIPYYKERIMELEAEKLGL